LFHLSFLTHILSLLFGGGAFGVSLFLFLNFSLTQNQILKISQKILQQQDVSSRILNYNSRSSVFKIRVLVVRF
ncbi:Segregation and condensation protein B, partial [Bienertia sinuspersici]